MLDFVGTVAITMTMIVVVNAFVGALSIQRAHRFALLLLIGAWVGLAVALASAGAFDDAGRRPFPLIGVAFAAPLVVAAAAAISSAAVRSALLALPMPLLVGLNATRVFGAFFLALAAADRLGGPFPYSAGWGDIVTGVLAIPVAVLAARSATDHIRTIGTWNAFGALDLVVAVGLGITSAPGSPLPLFAADMSSSTISYLPWALIPTVLVPFFLILHGVVFAQLRARARGAGRRAGQPAGQFG